MAAKRSGAGGLRQKLHFQKRGEAVDEWGNPTGGSDYATVFTDMAELVPRMGGEAVQAARLAGTQPYTIRARSNANTRQVRPHWRIVDARDSTRIMAIKAISDPEQKNQFLEILAVDGELS